MNQPRHDWQPSNEVVLNSMSTIFSIAISKTVTKAIKDNVPRDKRHQISKQLSSSWSQESNPESFRSRLLVTSLPSPPKITSGNDPLSNEAALVSNNALNGQELLAKQRVLDAYHAEELRQLDHLKNYLSDLESDLARDQAKLEQYSKSNQDVLSSWSAEENTMKQDLQLDQFVEAGEDEGISLAEDELISHFDPNTDADIGGRLEQLQSHLRDILDKSASLRSFNDQVESVYNVLD
ncbi:hypothetical protein KGF57_003275 [Candida theae]|uniref:Uncharacterized protein n=1 Tax=Candida theae TaxID=1198502 RepID=A0AAD5BE05_9ASCO|nr:uncharacterized protein KGF57_003275 [Candida theae]KAI5957581.1 hypothetical protein KGF57_003275 [Candida theae]